MCYYLINCYIHVYKSNIEEKLKKKVKKINKIIIINNINNLI